MHPDALRVLTGRYAWRTALTKSVLWPWDPPLIETSRLTLPELLRAEGYRTVCIGKWHLGWDWPLDAASSVTDELTGPTWEPARRAAIGGVRTHFGVEGGLPGAVALCVLRDARASRHAFAESDPTPGRSQLMLPVAQCPLCLTQHTRSRCPKRAPLRAPAGLPGSCFCRCLLRWRASFGSGARGR
ncbi:MAG: sulfatase-like hydrolase/transferase [Planctomycetota bacterium]